jgi:enoyl-CoA hydratase
MKFETIRYSVSERIARLTLNRPERLNAINPTYENMGLASTQTLATLFDGITRHSPEGVTFREHAATAGFHEAVRLRDSGEPIPGSKPTPPGI